MSPVVGFFGPGTATEGFVFLTGRIVVRKPAKGEELGESGDGILTQLLKREPVHLGVVLCVPPQDPIQASVEDRRGAQVVSLAMELHQRANALQVIGHELLVTHHLLQVSADGPAEPRQSQGEGGRVPKDHQRTKPVVASEIVAQQAGNGILEQQTANPGGRQQAHGHPG